MEDVLLMQEEGFSPAGEDSSQFQIFYSERRTPHLQDSILEKSKGGLGKVGNL